MNREQGIVLFCRRRESIALTLFPLPSLFLFLPSTCSLTHSPQGPTATLGIYVDSGSVYETAETTGKS